jgi:spore coat protein A, manganese oxidase
MRNQSTMNKFLKFVLLATLLLSLSVASMAQLKLRRAVDYDCDGKADPAIFRPTNNTWYITRSGGGATVQPFGSANTDFPVPGDYDGDGKGDIAIWRDTDGTFYILRSSTGTVQIQAWGITNDEPVARDYDGDNKTDFAVARRANGVITWYILGSQSGSFRADVFGLSTDFVVPGDYDGDGKFDLCVQRGTANNGPATFYWLGSTAGYNIIQWGASNDFTAPGDYDGDGKTDFAVVRDNGAGALIWFIRLSGNPNNPLVYQWGSPTTDYIVQNDYDGDGKADAAVWRDSDGIFYILKSSGGFAGSQWGGPSDLPIASYDSH